MGGGAFSPKRSVLSWSFGASDVVTADLDSDGDLDIAACSSGANETFWFRNNGTGGFSSRLTVSATTLGARSLVAAQLNGDAALDLLVSSASNGVVAVFFNNGTGGFGPKVVLSSTSLGAWSVDAVDLNGDGRVDALAASRYDNILAWYENGGNGAPWGTFGSRRVISDAVIEAVSISTADLNSDGSPDVLGVSYYGFTVIWYANDGAGGFAADGLVLGEQIYGVCQAIGADLNGDSIVDVVVSLDGLLLPMIGWFPSQSKIFFGAATSVATGLSGPNEAQPVDLDNDGLLDILASTGDFVVAWYRNDGNGGFTARRVISNSGYSVGAAFDLSGDGALDVIVAGADVAYYPSIGRGLFASQPIVITVGANDPGYEMLASATDLSGDGALDVVWSGSEQHLAWSRNNGTGGFGPMQPILGNGRSYSIVGCDVDGDGDTDLLLAQFDTGSFIFLRNDGNGLMFSRYNLSLTSPGASVLIPADLNNDGLVDMVAAANDASLLGWYRNNGTTNFGPLQLIETTSLLYPVSASTGDLDNDGDIDVCAAFFYNVLGCYLNLFNATSNVTTFTNMSLLVSNAISFPGSLHIADVTNDGIVDLVTTGKLSKQISYFSGKVTMAAFRWRPPRALPYECGNVADTPSCMAARITAVSSRCFASSLRLPPRIRGCLASPLRLPGIGPLSLSPATPGSRTNITCTSPQRQSLLEVGAGAALIVTNVDVVVASGVAVAPSASLFSACSQGCDAADTTVLTLVNVTITGFANAGDDPASPLASGFGAVSVYGQATVSIDGGAFVRNSCGKSGGALSILGAGARVVVRGTSFLANRADGLHSNPFGGGGGAVAVTGDGAEVSLSGCTFAFNSSPLGDGGAVLVAASSVHLSLAACNVRNCTAGVMGGALATGGGVLNSARVTASTFSGCSATLGGTFAAASDVLDGVTVSGDVVSRLPRGGAAAIGGGIHIEGGGTVVTDSRAVYGGTAFACSATVNASQAAVGMSRASTAGGFAFTCNAKASVSVPWIAAPPNAAAISSAQSFGSLLASPPAVMTAALGGAVPASAVSGATLGSGTILLLDSYGQQVILPGQLVLRAQGTDASGVVAPSVLFISQALDGSFDLSAFSLAIRGWPETLGAAAPVSVTIEGLAGVDGAPVLNLTVSVLGCPSGSGRTSADSTATPLVCAPCAEGTGSNDTGSLLGHVSPCVAVPVCAGASIIDGNVCVPCPPGNVKGVNGSTVVCLCSPGFWSPSGAQGVECLACPIGATCAGNTDAPVAAPGFYPEGGLFLACPNARACAAAGVCARGYAGRLCGSCALGYYTLNGQCYRCNQAQTAVLAIVLILVGVGLGVALVLFNLTEQSHRFVAAMIGLQALQLSAMFGRLELDWGAIANAYFDVISALNINFQLSSPECSIARSVDAWTVKWILTMLLPVFALAALALAAALVLAARRWPFAKVLDASWRAWVQVMALLYLPLTAGAFVLFGCRRDGSGKWILVDLPSRRCYDQRWWRLFVPAVIAVLVYALALPAALFGALRRARSQLDEVMFLLRFGFLAGRFTSSCWAFELANMGTKLGVVLCMTFFASTDGRASSAVVVLAASAIAVATAHPYCSRFHNTLAIAVTTATAAVLFGGTVSDSKLSRTMVLGGILICVLAIFAGNAIDIYLMIRAERLSLNAARFFLPAERHTTRDKLQSFGGGTGGVEPSVLLTIPDTASAPMTGNTPNISECELDTIATGALPSDSTLVFDSAE